MEESIFVQFVRDAYSNDESKWLQKNIKPELLEKKVSSLVEYMIDPSQDELNEGYTPKQQEAAMEIERYLNVPKEEKPSTALIFRAKTRDGNKFIILDDELKKYPDIVLTEETEDGIGKVDQKKIYVVYMWLASGQIAY